MNTLRNYFENLKVKCPSCPLPHNLSSKQVDAILSAIAKRDEEAVGKEEHDSHLMMTKYDSFDVRTRNKLRSEIKQNLDESRG